jgi:hypothetical protein
MVEEDDSSVSAPAGAAGAGALEVADGAQADSEEDAGASGEGEGEQPAAAIPAAVETRIVSLETRVSSLQTFAEASSSIPEMAEYTPYTALNKIDAVAAVMLPIAYLLTLVGWRIVPAFVGFWTFWWLVTGHYWLALFCLLWTGATAFLGGSSHEQAQLFRRSGRVYAAALVAWCDYKLMRQGLASGGGMEEGPAADAVWEAAHRRNAARFLRLMRDLKGLWVKCGQYFSSRPDFMPQPYLAAFATLQACVGCLIFR